MSYIISWFYWCYYILSPDDTFPKDEDVRNALQKKKLSTSQEVLEKCKALFWFQPATTLHGLMPGVLDLWDVAYNEHLPNFEGTAYCDPEDPDWRQAWMKYATSITDGMLKLSQASSYVKLPPRAISRMRYFLHCMSGFHSMTVFPTKTFIRDMAATFTKSKEAFCDVSTRDKRCTKLR